MRARLILREMDRQRMSEGWRDLALAGLLATSSVAAPTAAVAQPAAASRAQIQSFDDFFRALHQVEASGKYHPRDGDGGRAIGPFQIWKAYWRDALEFDPSIGGRYQDCRNYAYAKKVVAAYLQRHAPDAWAKKDFATLAAVHNGGPTGASKPATKEYVSRVQSVMATRGT